MATEESKGQWPHEIPLNGPDVANGREPPIDLIALRLVAAIWVTAREQLAWRRQHSRLLKAVREDAGAAPAMAGKDAGGTSL